MIVDLNCDLGEGVSRDAELMALVTSANIACGGHAGDEATMRAAVAAAERHGVGVGAHPGYADREHFGRRELMLSPRELAKLVIGQLEVLREIGPVRHVKPHGALYNLAARDRGVAEVFANAVLSVDRELIVFALANCQLVGAARARGLRVAEEVFADRTYQPDGSLTPRSGPGAVITEPERAVEQAVRLVCEGAAVAVDGTRVPLRADTICLHGDGAQAVGFARAVRGALQTAGVALKRFGG